jgi:hypothetical protein
VQLAARLAQGRITCLPRACALHWLLTWRGRDSRICFGVRADDRGLEAHAWVELDGVAVGETVTSGLRFIPLRGAGGRAAVTTASDTRAAPETDWTHRPAERPKPH